MLTDGSLLLFLLLPLALVLALAAMVFLMVRRAAYQDGLEPDEAMDAPPAERPWWGNPLLWLAVSAVFLLLGLFVAPRFFPGAIVFLPFLWIARPRGRRGPKDGTR